MTQNGVRSCHRKELSCYCSASVDPGADIDSIRLWNVLSDELTCLFTIFRNGWCEGRVSAPEAGQEVGCWT